MKSMEETLKAIFSTKLRRNFTNNEKARFIIEKNTKETFFPKIYSEQEYKFIDTTTNYVLATAFNISFLVDNRKFRNRYLYCIFSKKLVHYLSSSNKWYLYKNIMDFVDEI